MPNNHETHTWARLATNDGHSVPYVKRYSKLQGENSPRVHGNLVLKANSHYREVGMLTYTSYSVPNLGGVIYTPACYSGLGTSHLYGAPLTLAASTEVSNRLYAKIRGKLYKGNAALGITALQYKQSREMVVNASALISTQADKILAESLATPGRAKRLAGKHLEVIFGWQPLVSDIVAASTSVIQGADVYDWVNATVRGAVETAGSRWDPRTIRSTARWRARTTVQVRIENPNRWLSERLGTNNFAAVAWDNVPWSFLVNQFVNTGALVNQITDFAGLSFHNPSTTRSYVIFADVSYNGGRYYNSFSAQVFSRGKTRALTGITPPSRLEFKLPDVNWDWACMMTSLAVQNATKVLRLPHIMKKLGA